MTYTEENNLTYHGRKVRYVKYDIGTSGKFYYHIEYYVPKFWYFFGDEWKPLVISYAWPKQFETKGDAKAFLDSLNITKTIEYD